VFARVTSFAVKPGALTPLIAVAREQIIPRSREQAGFMRAVFLTRSRINKAVYTSYWRTEYDALKAEEGGLLEAEMSLFEPHAAGPAIVEGYEVSVFTDAAE
jgi:hypothetical protein